MSEKYSIKEYSEEQTEAASHALVELGPALELYHDDIILIGGWAPYLLTKGFFDHCGTEDIDFALRRGTPNKGETIRQIIQKLGYEEKPNFPHRFYIEKEIDGKKYEVRLDFLCEAEDISKHVAVQEDLVAAPFPDIGIAFDFNSELEIKDINGTATTSLKVADLVGTLVMKSNVNDRNENKYNYDVFALTFYKGGPVKASACFKQLVSDKIYKKMISKETIEQVKKGVQRTYNNFNLDKRWGAHWVHMFDEKYEYDDVLAQMNRFLEPVIQFLNSLDTGN